jgi:hypothetical protein
MRLPGRLCWTTLGDLLGALYRERATGVLELIEATGGAAGRVHRVHFDEGLVESVETPLGALRLGELLKREGFLGAEAERRLLRALAADPGRRSGEVLVQEGLVTTTALRAALRRQLRTRLEALFSLGDAFVRFRIARPRSYTPQSAQALSPREFLYGRARRRDRQQGPRAAQRGASPAPARVVDPRRAALDVLGLGEGADRRDVQRAFRKLAASVHPDRHPSASAEQRAELMRRFAELSAAYHALVA